MNSHIRSFIHQHNLALARGAAGDPRGHPAGTYGGDGAKTWRVSPAEERRENPEAGRPQSNIQCIKAKQEAQATKSGPCMFPLNQCTNFALHDTKHSVRVSVKFAVQDYAARLRPQYSMEDAREDPESSYTEEDGPIHNYTTEAPPPITPMHPSQSFDVSLDIELGSSPIAFQQSNLCMGTSIYDFGSARDGGQDHVRGSSESVDSMPSISSLKPGPRPEEVAAISSFNQMLNEKMSAYLRDKFTQSYSKREPTSSERKDDTEAIKEAVIFCTNLFLQEFKSSDPEIICEEFQELRGSGELKELLHDVFQDLIEKVESLNFDKFQDFVIESITFSRAFQKTNNPEIYDKFVGIWALHNESFLEIDLEILLMYCDLGEERQFSYFTSAERFYNELEEAAVRMNLVKFFYTYKWELMKQRKKKLEKKNILSDLDCMQSLLENGIERYSQDLYKQMGLLRIRDDNVRKNPDFQSSNALGDESDTCNRGEPLCGFVKKKKSLRFTDEVCVG